MKGFFCDFIHVVCNWKGNREMNTDVAEDTEVYKKLVYSQFGELVNVVCESPLSQITKEATGCDFCIVAPLFLFLKSVFTDGVNLSKYYNGKSIKELIDYAKTFDFEFALTTYLLGLTLGFDKTYDAYYDTIDLPIFKRSSSNIDDTSIKETINSKTSISKVGNNSNDNQIENMDKQKKLDIQEGQVSLFPEKEQSTGVLGKFFKGKKYRKNSKLILVYTKADFDKYSSDPNFTQKK